MKAKKFKSSKRSPDERMITFEITTSHPLPVGQQVFIAGNLDMLGNWQADGFPLTRLDDNVWTGYTVIAEGLPVEFKITRGTWATEEADEHGQPLTTNHTLPANGNANHQHTVLRWIDKA